MSFLQGKGIWTFRDDVALAIQKAPEVGASYILCKVSLHGSYDPEQANAALALLAAAPGLVPVAWTYPYLENIDAEVECARLAFQNGFQAFIFDVEYDTLNKFQKVQQLAKKVIDLGLDTSRIYLCADPRLDTKLPYYPILDYAKICQGGFMPMTYGEIMPGNRLIAAKAVVSQAYIQYSLHKVELGYTQPLMPIISTHWDQPGKQRMTYAELKKWCEEVEVNKPTFVSLWRAGFTRPDAWQAFKELNVSNGEVENEILQVQPYGVGYTEQPAVPGANVSGWSSLIDNTYHLVRYRKVAKESAQVLAAFDPKLNEAGRYIVEVYIPSTHATTQYASYILTSYKNGLKVETPVTIDQSMYSNVWVPLGTFDLDKQMVDDGMVQLCDLTQDKKVREIAFSTIRWRKVMAGGLGFDAPVGTAEERRAPKIWPGLWVNANPYLNKYFAGYHTGADLNLNSPAFDLDRGAPVYAIADGLVTFARTVGGSWNGLVVIDHGLLPDGSPVFSRYAHVEQIQVAEGAPVKRGDQLAVIGLYKSNNPQFSNYHLHFDISCSEILKNSPRHWPNYDLNSAQKNYVDPKKFIDEHRP